MSKAKEQAEAKEMVEIFFIGTGRKFSGEVGTHLGFKVKVADNIAEVEIEHAARLIADAPHSWSKELPKQIASAELGKTVVDWSKRPTVVGYIPRVRALEQKTQLVATGRKVQQVQGDGSVADVAEVIAVPAGRAAPGVS